MIQRKEKKKTNNAQLLSHGSVHQKCRYTVTRPVLLAELTRSKQFASKYVFTFGSSVDKFLAHEGCGRIQFPADVNGGTCALADYKLWAVPRL